MLAIAAAILLARYMKDVLIPFVLAALMFYALDPLVDRLQRMHVPRGIGSAFALLLFVGTFAGTGYALRYDALSVVEELPGTIRKIRTEWALEPSGEPSTLEKLQVAARELEETATAASTSAAPAMPSDVGRVQIEEPMFRASDYVWGTSMGLLILSGQAVLVIFLTYFLLVYDDLFKRKLVEIVGPTLARKKVTVQVLNEIAVQIERFLLIQLLTSAIVAVATGLALWWVGLRHPFIWGMAAGILNSVPYFGPFIVSAALGLVGFVQFQSIASAFGVAGIAFVITTIEGYVLTPALMGRAAEMNRIAVFAGLLFWSWLWGVPGMLLAVPLMMIVKVVCDHIEELQPVGTMLGE